MDLSNFKCSNVSGNAVLTVFSTRPTSRTCLRIVRLGSGAADRMIFSKRYTLDALCGLTVGLE